MTKPPLKYFRFRIFVGPTAVAQVAHDLVGVPVLDVIEGTEHIIFTVTERDLESATISAVDAVNKAAPWFKRPVEFWSVSNKK